MPTGDPLPPVFFNCKEGLPPDDPESKESGVNRMSWSLFTRSSAQDHVFSSFCVQSINAKQNLRIEKHEMEQEKKDIRERIERVDTKG